MAFARSMAGAVTAVWLVTGAARATIGHLVDTMNEPLPGAELFCARHVCLPLHSDMTDTEADRVLDAVGAVSAELLV